MHKKLFMGLSFFVADLEATQDILERVLGVANSDAGRLQVQRTPGLPRFIYFFDPAFTPVELTDDHM